MTTIALKAKSQFQVVNLADLMSAVVKRLQLWIEKHHQRRVLAGLDEHLRRDIGISLEQVRHEVSQPFWR
jgi:uncharacterized protein YjiS (DUF1127 family)